jgi:hypothetical protein
MKIHRSGPTLMTISALLVAALPATAYANPLLSGYGGPGQGTQVILGASLVNGPGGGGSSNGGGASKGGPSASVPASPAAEQGAVGGAGASGSHANAGGPRTANRGGPRGAHAGAGTGAASARASVLSSGAYPESEKSVAQPSGGFGLSTTGLLEVLLALCALAATLVAVRRLTRGISGAGGQR